MKVRTGIVVCLLAVLLGFALVEALTESKTVVLSGPLFRNGWTESDYLSLILD